MKKLIYLCLAFCMTTTISFAQKLTDKDLQGTWNVVALDLLETEGIYFDLIKGDVEFSEAIKSQTPAEALEQAKVSIAPTITMLKEMKMIITGNNIQQYIPGEEVTGVYTLVNENEKQKLKIIYSDDTEDFVEVYMKEGKLYIDLEQDGLFIYKKG
ncbi:hypothetical protein [Flavobacterium beibuense]|uniref:Lipocalin-like domain-containing protein n=1 Tax=Flavobacterium beibuense TaxID=657326 RepID=A0A444W887_9FLAO|nr:hypothetical protein [Flavobacterium beibuense]RYJ42074.1 hypothetical protein NU09_2478 [Flavobacterium beibuense]